MRLTSASGLARGWGMRHESRRYGGSGNAGSDAGDLCHPTGFLLYGIIHSLMGRRMQLTRLVLVVAALAIAGCSSTESQQMVSQPATPTAMYIIGPLDGIEIFVWRSPELSRGVAVRPDGRISVPL